MMRKTTDDANSEEEMQVGGHWSTWLISHDAVTLVRSSDCPIVEFESMKVRVLDAAVVIVCLCLGKEGDVCSVGYVVFLHVFYL